MRTPVGRALLGRVVDPLGRPLDEGPAIAAERRDPVERSAPAILDRALVTQPVQTGILVIDSLFPLGRGQRELIIGDRAIGKTAIAVDTIINQKTSDLICVYVAVGQKSATVARVADAVRRLGAAERCIFVIASPAAGARIAMDSTIRRHDHGGYSRDQGQHALVVIDDLSKHAATHREIALLTRQPPDARPILATCSTCTHDFWSARRSWRRHWVAARSPRCRSRKPTQATSAPTFRPT